MKNLDIHTSENQTTITDRISSLATVHGNCDHQKVATQLAASPDLLRACEIALHVLHKTTWDSETPTGSEIAGLYELLPQVIERSKDNTVNIDWTVYPNYRPFVK